MRSSARCGRRSRRSSSPFLAPLLGAAWWPRMPAVRLLRSLARAAVGQQLEAERAGDRRGLDQPHRYRVAEPVGLAAGIADQRMAVLLIAEIFVADRARRDETVGAGIVELDEQAGAGDAGNVALERGADPVGEEMREQAVEGLALRLH